MICACHTQIYACIWTFQNFYPYTIGNAVADLYDHNGKLNIHMSDESRRDWLVFFLQEFLRSIFYRLLLYEVISLHTKMLNVNFITVTFFLFKFHNISRKYWIAVIRSRNTIITKGAVEACSVQYAACRVQRAASIFIEAPWLSITPSPALNYNQSIDRLIFQLWE